MLVFYVYPKLKQQQNKLGLGNLTNCNSHAQKKIIETINYEKNGLNSNLRRAFHCSFEYNNYLYLIGGYSFSKTTSFVSRLNLLESKWEHDFDRKSSTIVNRSNRKLYSNTDFKEPKLDLPENRYAHSCALDSDNVIKIRN